MGTTVYGRKALRRFERETGEQLVQAAGPFVTTVDHRHLLWTGERWSELEQPDGRGGCGVSLSSCRWLFGDVDHGFTRGLMRGPCSQCGVGCSELHRWDCGRLNTLMTHVNPDYWPRPVHRPLWMDDPRCPSSHTALTLRLAITMDVPVEVMMTGADVNCWSYYEHEGSNARAQVNGLLAQVAPKILRDAGLDPERYQMEWREDE